MEYQKSRYNLPLTPPHGLKEFMRGHPDDVTGVILYKMEYYTDAFGTGRRCVKNVAYDIRYTEVIGNIHDNPELMIV